MNSDRLMNTFFELVQIDSPSRKEKLVADYCEAYLARLGFEITFDNSAEKTGSNANNIIAFLPGTADGHVAFSSHMDCVEPCLGVVPVIENGIVSSRSDTILGADDKAGISAILEGVESVIESGILRPDITIILTTCEEISLVGSAALDESLLPQGVPCFVLDADGDPGTIIYGSPYHHTIEAKFSGAAAHAGVEPEAGTSTIQMAAEAIRNMSLGRLDDNTTANIGIIEGGREINIVPDTCLIKGECRSLYKEKADAQRANIIEACEQAATLFGGSVSIHHHLDYEGILYEESDSLIQSLKRAATQAGLHPKLAISGGGADSNNFQSKGLRAVTLGIGMTHFHSLDEHIAVKDIEGTASFVESIIKEFTA